MSETGLIAKIRALLTGEAAETEASIEEVELVAIDAAKDAEIERLRAKLEAKNAESVNALAAAEEERANRITAEVESTVEKYSDRLGRDGREAFAVLLREVKDGSVTEASLLSFMEAIPSVVSKPTALASVDVETVAAEAAGSIDPLAALNATIEARLGASGIKRGTKEWGEAFQSEYRRANQQ